MNRKSVWARIASLVAVTFAILFEGGVSSALAQYLRPYQIVPDFTIYNRRRWTNFAGRVFGKNAPMRLSDFAGSVVFMKFFDPT